MSIDTLPPLRKVIERHGLIAKKSLGQHFIHDLNLIAKIVRQVGDLKGQTVIEVGSGPGGLTRALLEQGAYVIAIERDERCLEALQEISVHYPGQLTMITGNALEQDFSRLIVERTKPRIVSNLPYNIGTRLLVTWLLEEPWPPFYTSMTLMFQREVAERITAHPGDDSYGRLSILAGWRTEAKIIFNVPPQAFTPSPKVISSLVHLIPRDDPLPCNALKLGQITQAAFGQRRKMLRQSFRSLGGEILLNKVGIDPTRRAETLSIAEYVVLANAL